MTENHEILIIGKGVAALVLAARLTELGRGDICICASGEGGTPCVAALNAVMNGGGDSESLYCEDMMKAGYGISNRELVEEMCAATHGAYELLHRWGVAFSLLENGRPRLRRTSGSSVARSLCSTEGLIGIDIERKLTAGLLESGVVIRTGCECRGLMAENGRVFGASFVREDGELEVYAGAVVAAWGGVGHLLGASTYPGDINGRMFAEALRAGAELVDMEFLEYEPMIVLGPEGAVGEPCPTAMLGEGAQLLNSRGERFVLKYRPEGEAGAPKTLLNRAIWKEVAEGRGSAGGGVWVDLRGIPESVLTAYPWFTERLRFAGLDPAKELVEVGPMPHSISGGIAVDKNCRSKALGLYAVGEAAGGFHGACRIGGNAAAQAAASAMICAENMEPAPVSGAVLAPPLFLKDEMTARRCKQAIDNAAKALEAFRNGEQLEKSASEMEKLLREGETDKDTASKQRAIVVLAMLRAALERRESRGVHLRTDYPEQDPEFQHEIKLGCSREGLPEIS